MADLSQKQPAAPTRRRERRGPFVIGRVDGERADDLLNALCPDPGRLFDQGATIQSRWQTEGTDKVVVTVQGESYFLKRYNCTGWVYRVKNVFRRSRGEKSWEAAWRFHQLGLPTPLPLLWMEERRWRLLGASILAFPYFGAARSLLDYWPEVQNDRKSQILDVAASVIGRMHQAGVLHGDLNWRNLLVQDVDAHLRIFLVDLDGYRCLRALTLQKAEKDLSHFLRDLGRAGGDEVMRGRFLQAWRQNFIGG